MPHLAGGVKSLLHFYSGGASTFIFEPPIFYITMPPSTASTWPVM
jgi:hypothetical protein